MFLTLRVKNKSELKTSIVQLFCIGICFVEVSTHKREAVNATTSFFPISGPLVRIPLVVFITFTLIFLPVVDFLSLPELK